MVEILHEYWPRLAERIIQAGNALASPDGDGTTNEVIAALREACLSAEFLGLGGILPVVHALEDACAAAGPDPKSWRSDDRAKVLGALANLARAVSAHVGPDVLRASEEAASGREAEARSPEATASSAAPSQQRLEEIPVDGIECNEQLHEAYTDRIRALASSIDDSDLRPPILVVAKGSDRWLLVAGMLRLGIARVQEWRTIPAIVMEEDRVPEALWQSDEFLLREEFYQIEHARHHAASPPLQDQIARAAVAGRKD